MLKKMLHIGAEMLMGSKKRPVESPFFNRNLPLFNSTFFLVVFDFMKVAPLRLSCGYQRVNPLMYAQPIYTQIHTHTHALGRGELSSSEGNRRYTGMKIGQ